MFEAFRLRSAIGHDMSMGLDDTLATKKALHSLGHFQTPSYGLTEYPDQAMIDGLKSFQRANDLKVDGVMRPGGPTMRKLDAALASRQQGGAASLRSSRLPELAEMPARPGMKPSERVKLPARPRDNPLRRLNLKHPVKVSASVDLDDTLSVKTALASLGLLPTPKDGLSPYPDRAMFDAVEAFQRQRGFRVDGEMAPDGPTLKKINAALGEQAEEGANTQRRAMPGDETKVAQVAVPPSVTPVVPGAGGALGTGDGATGGLPPNYRYRGPDIDWASAWSGLPDEVRNRILQLGSLPLATKTLLEGLAADRDKRPSPPQSSFTGRTQMADPLPSVPPSEPSPAKDKLPDRTELLPTAALGPSTEVFPVVDDELPDMIGGYPDQSDELPQGSILESRGGLRTKRLNWLAARRTPKTLSAYGLDLEALGCSMKQVGGSFTPKPESERRTEKWYKEGKNRRAARTDITWKIECPDQQDIYVDLQTVTTLADGVTPIPSELDAGMRVTAWRKENNQRGFVLNVPKAPAMSDKEWVRTHLDPAIEEMAKRLKRMIENNDMN